MRSRLGFTMSAGPPIVTYVLIGLNVAVFVLATFLVGGDWVGRLALWPGTPPDLAAYCAITSDPECQGLGVEWYRWITAGFAHFGWVHLGMNMFALWNLGQTLEPVLGRWRYLGIYAASLLGSSAAVMMLAGFSAHAGASGAIFGLVGAYGVVLRKLRLPSTGVLVIAGIFIAGPLIAQFIPGLSMFTALSWQGHLGGAVVGAVLMLVMLHGVERRQQVRAPQAPPADGI